MNYLKEAAVLNLLHTETVGIGYLRKPEKIFLENTNLNYALSDKTPDTGNLRETFFVNQLKKDYRITAAKQADFLVNNELVFEIGGKAKKRKQIAGLSNVFTVHDEIETGTGNKIPLWLFGFLY